MTFKHPLAHVHEGYNRVSPVYLADYVSAEDGTGIVHAAPAYGVDDFNSCIAHGLKFDDILNPVQKAMASTKPICPCLAVSTSGRQRPSFWRP